MLDKRTSVLLTQADHYTLERIALREDKTVSELIRHAVGQVYDLDGRGDRSQLMADIRKLAQKVNTKGINYKRLIEDGRKI